MISDRYQTTDSQALWQPGSNEQVLLNKPGITNPALMDEAELDLLLQLYEFVLLEQFPDPAPFERIRARLPAKIYPL